MSVPLNIDQLRHRPPRVLALGSHRGSIQSILDFDTLVGHKQPSIAAIIATGRRSERYFFGGREVLIPVYPEPQDLPVEVVQDTGLILNVLSGRRAVSMAIAAMEALPQIQGGMAFAERMPERLALDLRIAADLHQVWLIGAASIGLLIPGALKLGPIGGTESRQLIENQLFAPGTVAVLSVSGGITNELIHQVIASGHLVSFAASIGGEHWPLSSPAELMLAAEADPATHAIVYTGELGGTDEHEVAALVKSGRITKPVIAYIAGRAADLFPEPPQFGHAGAIATVAGESAEAKTAVLRDAGVQAPATFREFLAAIHQLPGRVSEPPAAPASADQLLHSRRPSLLATTVSRDRADGSVEIAGRNLLELASTESFAVIILMTWLGRSSISPELEAAADFILRLSIDHGPYQSAVINTMVASRAGQNLTASLASGLLTIGPRFGGAVNAAAATWLAGVRADQPASTLVENYAAQRQYIAGIGHRKYNLHQPDPRVAEILRHTEPLESRPFTDFALAVADTTTRKRANLILNIDGAIAAVLLDLLHAREGLSIEQLQRLIEVEFFNAFFILSRSVGLIAHYFDQVRIDEGLLRLGPDDVAFIEP